MGAAPYRGVKATMREAGPAGRPRSLPLNLLRKNGLGSRNPLGLLTLGDGLDHVLEAVFHGVPRGRALGLVADFADHLASGLADQFHADARIGRPPAPVAGSAAGLPCVEDVAVDLEISAGLDDLEPLFLEPLLGVVLALARRVPALDAMARVVEVGDRHGLVLAQAAVGKEDPVGVGTLGQLVVIRQELLRLVLFLGVIGVGETL